MNQVLTATVRAWRDKMKLTQKTAAELACVTTYHIDSPRGLRVFVKMLRRYGLGKR